MFLKNAICTHKYNAVRQIDFPKKTNLYNLPFEIPSFRKWKQGELQFCRYKIC